MTRPDAVTELSVPPSDEPFDFRHQASTYARYRRDYSSTLYAAIEECAGAAAGRLALDLGCGTGFVASSLRARRWHPTGVDFSEPMLREARRISGNDIPFIRARGEALPIRDGSIALLTCGTAFHWLAPAPALAEVSRVLTPGAWAALFWRYPDRDTAPNRIVGEVLARCGLTFPMGDLYVHPPEPFLGSALDPQPVRLIETTLEYTAESFHGYLATVEWLRRLLGERHAEFLSAVRLELEQRFAGSFTERNTEHLFLARKPGT